MKSEKCKMQNEEGQHSALSQPSWPVYVNGEIVPAESACVSVFDRGFMRGDGLFETMRTYGGKVFKLDEHLARLDHGLEALHFPVRSSNLKLKSVIKETIHASGLKSARVRAQVTRGAGTTEFTARTDASPTVVITVQPMVEKPTLPLNVIISSIRRDERSPLAAVKTINYVPSILARFEAEEKGADDAILLNYAGNVAEGCTSNIFIVFSGKLMTPDLASGVLPGITRRTILEVAAELRIKTVERPVYPSLLDRAEEVFLTSSTREAVPVATIDGKQVGSGRYEITELIEREYRKRAEA